MRITAPALLCAFASLATANPLDWLGIASWDVEGFAKDNPIGKTTGGKGGPTVTVTSVPALQTAVVGSDPKTIVLRGEFALPARLNIGSNKSLVGFRDTAHITGKGLNVYNATNVIVQNLKISFILDNDCITIRNSTRVWVDHNEFTSDISQGPDLYVRLLMSSL
ncbi:Pectate lyase B [Colletotrichum tanaceti]|nr:Pectate lyase B [Colletotrichum tanaceti]